MRVFIGIELDHTVKTLLCTMQDQLKASILRAKFTRFDNFHITLKFLGEVTHKDIEDIIIPTLDIVLSSRKSFDIKIGDLGVFHRYGKALLWASILEGVSELNKLDQIINKNLCQYKERIPKKKFHPHVTLAREVEFDPLHDEAIKLKTRPMLTNVNKVTLFESKRIHTGLVYIPIHEVHLS